ncbi:P-type 2 magnesium transport ATPase [Rhizoclosmatium globosum]|uniref:P-type 2 magnesium transport ATPase n=1 Tax=Rhizoclosmatium globosum TaxID=329046 RepID=A0A1Y2C2X6_9FUNG|nr:P-type 2 magnesium transport ATPase [Rhizoclosmatium globosum]|eukprot:ORY41403.1 P-type 2 magnesium transport ATPase [Rhizoclosmatium globosum]
MSPSSNKNSNEFLVADKTPGVSIVARESNAPKPLTFQQRMKPELEEQRQEASAVIVNYASLQIDAVLQRLSVDAEERILQYGPNKMTAGKAPTWYEILFKAVTHPFQILLIVLAVSHVSIPGNQDYRPFAYLMFMFTFAAVIGFVQEMRSTSAAAQLLAMYKTHVSAFRRKDRDSPAELVKLERSEIVPGDIIQLNAGTVFPGDCIIISANDLMVGESSLTGESAPVEKFAGPVDNSNGLLECANIGLSGTNVQSGVGKAVVVNTGDRTFISGVAAELSGSSGPTAYDRVEWITAYEFGIATACGVVPEMLPVIVNANLIKGAMSLVKRKAIVKKMSSIQNIGSMDVLCSDKTGTLTKDEIVLIKSVGADGNETSTPLRYGYINSHFQKVSRTNFGSISSVTDSYDLVAEIPFDFERRCMSVIVSKKAEIDKVTLVCKGAVEEILAHSSHYIDQHGIQQILDIKKIAQVTEIINEMNADGLRVLDTFSKTDEFNMIFHGCLAFLDPPKESSIEAIKELNALQVSVKVLTGDNLKVSVKICRDVGIPVEHVYGGHDLEAMTDVQFADAARKGTVFAKLSPAQKRRIVACLQDQGRCVGFLGDGINDALALKCADVGISVDEATDVAKEAADIILLEKSLLILSHAVRTGRTVFGNVTKYLKLACSANMGNVFSLLMASLWFPTFQPISALMILTINMLYNISQISLPWDTVDDSFIAEPRNWDIKDLVIFMSVFGPVSMLFKAINFSVYLYYWNWQMCLIAQTVIVHLIRTEKIPFFQSTASPVVLIMTTVVAIVGVCLQYTPIGEGFGMAPIPSLQYAFVAMNVALYVIGVAIVKQIYIKVYGRWL